MTRRAPYGPGQVSAFSPAGAWIVGVNDADHFEIHYPDGEITRVEKHRDPVPSRRADGPCDENYEDRGPSYEPCYEPDRAWDLFDLEGNFLGEVIRPAGRLFPPFFRDDLVLLHVADEIGTIMVKRHRLTIPEAGS